MPHTYIPYIRRADIESLTCAAYMYMYVYVYLSLSIYIYIYMYILHNT